MSQVLNLHIKALYSQNCIWCTPLWDIHKFKAKATSVKQTISDNKLCFDIFYGCKPASDRHNDKKCLFSKIGLWHQKYLSIQRDSPKTILVMSLLMIWLIYRGNTGSGLRHLVHLELHRYGGRLGVTQKSSL